MFSSQKAALVVLLCCLGTRTAQSQSTSSGTAAGGANALSAAGKQSQAPETQSAPSLEVLRVTTRMVLVDAVVTDGSGKPVADLKADDFKILENGKPQAIRGFGARSPELLQQQAASLPPARALPPGLFTNITDFHPEYGPLTVILIDSLNTPNLDQVYMREALIKYLQSMGPRQNVAIYTLGAHLGLIQNLNADPQILQEALKRIAADPSWKKKQQMKPAAVPNDQDSRARALAADLLGAGVIYDRERQIDLMQSSVQEFFPDQAARQLDDRVKFTLNALEQIARNVAGYPGRKNLIWMSAAFPLFVDPSDAGMFDARNYQPEVQQAANLLTNNEMAVYPVDVRGLVGGLLPDAASDAQRHGSFGGQAANRVLTSRTVALGASHVAMDHLAEQTGGRAYYNRNDIDHGIALSVRDGSTYYSIGYYPADKNWNGKFRKIELKVIGKGLHVAYRRGYFAQDPGHLTPEQNALGHKEFLASMALDVPTSTLLPVVSSVFPPDAQHSQVYVNVGVDPHAVLFEPQPGNRQQGQLEFATIVLDANGKPVTSKSDILKTELTPQTFVQVMSGSLVVRQKFDLPPGKYLLRIGVRDLQSNLIGTLTAKVEFAAPSN